jgi:hypothetical protein
MTLSTVVLFAPNRQKVGAYLAHIVRTFLLPMTINTSIRYTARIDISTATPTPSSITPAVVVPLGTISGTFSWYHSCRLRPTLVTHQRIYNDVIHCPLGALCSDQ